LSRISVKPESVVVDKAVVRLQALINKLNQDIISLKERVTTLENA
tara:strand:- start:2243 stop:2377 length:135 start_codon:yes stop_codon:yes gene_type:complete